MLQFFFLQKKFLSLVYFLRCQKVKELSTLLCDIVFHSFSLVYCIIPIAALCVSGTQQNQQQNNVSSMQTTTVSASSVLPGGHPGPLLSWAPPPGNFQVPHPNNILHTHTSHHSLHHHHLTAVNVAHQSTVTPLATPSHYQSHELSFLGHVKDFWDEERTSAKR